MLYDDDNLVMLTPEQMRPLVALGIDNGFVQLNDAQQPSAPRRVRNPPSDMTAWLLRRISATEKTEHRALFHLPDGTATPGLHFSGSGLDARRDYLIGILDKAQTDATPARLLELDAARARLSASYIVLANATNKRVRGPSSEAAQTPTRTTTPKATKLKPGDGYEDPPGAFLRPEIDAYPIIDLDERMAMLSKIAVKFTVSFKKKANGAELTVQ